MWEFDKFIGNVDWWGQFNEDPYVFTMTAQVIADHWGPLDSFGYVMAGNLLDVEIQIDPIPEPATMLLLGSGLIGLAWFRRKVKK